MTILNQLSLNLKSIIYKCIDFFTIPKKGPIRKNGFKLYSNFNDTKILKKLNHFYHTLVTHKRIKEYFLTSNAGETLFFSDVLNVNGYIVKFLTPELINDIKLYFGNQLKLDHVYLGISYTSNSKPLM